MLAPTLSRSLFGAVLCGSVCAALPTAGCADKKFGKAGDRESGRQRSEIERELITLGEHKWAGHYFYGDGLGVNVSLSLAPKSGFVFAWHGCLGLYDRNYGQVQVIKDQIVLTPELPNERKGFEGIATTFVPVRWGPRQYLIPPDELVAFCNAVNSSIGLPNHFFLLRVGDEKLPVEGHPDVPEPFRGHLLESPIVASVSQVGPSVTKAGVGSIEFHEVPLTLDAGAAAGIKPGMEFHVVEPDGLVGSATISEAEENVSKAIFVSLDDDPLPVAGWKLSTRPRWGTKSEKSDTKSDDTDKP